MIKFLLITILVFWLATKLAGFIIRTFLRQAGIRFQQSQGGFNAGQQQAQPQRPTRPERKTPDLGRMGEYVDFEEVK